MKLIDSLKQRARSLKREVLALWYAYQNPHTPWYAKVFTAMVVAYAFSPIDLIPDFVPVLGYLDDLILIPAGVALALKMVPPEVMAESRLKADQAEIKGKQKNWLIGGIIIVIWVVILFFIGRWIFTLIKK